MTDPRYRQHSGTFGDVRIGESGMEKRRVSDYRHDDAADDDGAVVARVSD